MMQKRKRFLWKGFLILLLAFLCMPSAVMKAKAPKLSAARLTMTVGQKKKLKVKNTKKKVTWKSSKPGIVKVSSKGSLTAKKAGKAVIRAKAGKKTLKCTVIVKKRRSTSDRTGQKSGECQTEDGILYIPTAGNRKGAGYPEGVLISSRKQLETYYQENRKYYSMAGSFKKTIDSFGASYFKDNCLVVLRVRSGGRQDRYRVMSGRYDYGKKEYKTEVQLLTSSSGSANLIAWHILIPVDGEIPEGTKIRVSVKKDTEPNSFAKAMNTASLDNNGTSARSLTEYAGIRTLTNGLNMYPAGSAGRQDYSGIQAFSYRLFEQTLTDAVKNQKKNPVVSPASAYFALSMAAMGSGGETQTEFAKVLGTSETMLEKNTLCSSLKKHLMSTKGSTVLSIANSVWLNQDFAASRDYLQGVVDYFDSEVYSGRIDSDEMKNAINQWGSEKTKGLIPDILEENLDPEVVMNLMNAVYLKAKWSSEFSAEDTRERTFYKEDGSSVRTEFLCSERMLDYVRAEGAEGAVLPYDDGKTVFLALRPTDGRTIREFAGKLDAAAVKRYLSGAWQAKFDFYMPVLDISYGMSMNEMLKAMGLERAFDARADFSKMSAPMENSLPVCIDRVTQKVKVKVNEEGTEAAAITDIAMKAESLPVKPPEIIRTLDMNSPYVYVIVDMPSQTPLFMGLVEDFASALSK